VRRPLSAAAFGLSLMCACGGDAARRVAGPVRAPYEGGTGAVRIPAVGAEASTYDVSLADEGVLAVEASLCGR